MLGNDANEKWKRLSRLLEPVHPRALGTARRLGGSAQGGDDLYQEAVLRAFDKIETLNDEARFQGWFFAVMLSVHRSRARRTFWRRFVSLEAVFGPGREPPAVNASQEDDYWSARRATRALGALDEKQKEAIVLFEIEGFSIEEVASMQNAKISAVKSRLARGRAKLRRHYEKMGWFEKRASAAALAAEEIPEGGKP